MNIPSKTTTSVRLDPATSTVIWFLYGVRFREWEMVNGPVYTDGCGNLIRIRK